MHAMPAGYVFPSGETAGLKCYAPACCSFGCLGYENLYLKESGASGILLGIALVVSTCGEMPVFLTAGWWLPRLGAWMGAAVGIDLPLA